MTTVQRLLPIPLAVVFFLIVGLLSGSTIKTTAMFLLILTLAGGFLCFSNFRDRVTPVLLSLALFVIINGVSTLYAASGKFALYEFLKVLAGFCLTLLLLEIAPDKGEETGRWIASILGLASAIIGLVSIDLLSTRIISGLVTGLLGQDYEGLTGVEAGVRMTSLFQNPNVFAGCAGLGVLLSLGLAVSSQDNRERVVHLCLLYVNSLAFLLAFSMGASGSIALAFLVYLLLEQKERRSGLVVLMVETLFLTGLAAAVISQTSFQEWNGMRPVPLLCVIFGAAGLCLLDRFLGARAAEKLQGKATVVLTGGVLSLAICYILVGWNWTGGISLHAGEGLRRAAYPNPGVYTLAAENLPIRVKIESQNQQETMMHTSTTLYDGPLTDASFTVPEGSLVVYFNFWTEEETRLESVSCNGTGGTYPIPLHYKLFPSFISNRLQGLFANENAIQRFVFFSDGLKLFQRAPIVGLGMGVFESGIKSVQSFYYETKYAHNHYIQVLAETGIVGLALFLSLLAVSALAVWRDFRQGKNAHPLTPALGAALVFMAGHAGVEVVFSTYSYLSFAFGVFGLISLCCGETLPIRREQLKTVAVLVQCGLLAGFGLLLGCNTTARRLAIGQGSMSGLVKAASMDPFEWADYMLSYVSHVTTMENPDSETLAQADRFVARLAQVDSNTIPIYLAEYEFRMNRTEDGFAMLRKYVSYVSSDPAAWQNAFDLLEHREEDTETFRSGVLELWNMLEEWNTKNMGTITVNEKTRAFLTRMGA